MLSTRLCTVITHLLRAYLDLQATSVIYQKEIRVNKLVFWIGAKLFVHFSKPSFTINLINNCFLKITCFRTKCFPQECLYYFYFSQENRVCMSQIFSGVLTCWSVLFLLRREKVEKFVRFLCYRQSVKDRSRNENRKDTIYPAKT